MRTRTTCGLAAVLVVACGAWVLAVAPQAQSQSPTKTPPQKPASADVLLGQALHQEQNEGRLQDAIATYTKVLAAADATRAQFRIGACYEKLGQAEARKAYELVVANYGDQSEFAAQAKARLTALAEPAGRPSASGPVIRQIWATGNGVSWNRISPDGRFVVGTDQTSGDLLVRSLATSEVRRLTAIPKDRTRKDFADSPIWSRDGRQIAYWWSTGTPPGEFRIMEMADGASRVVPIDPRFRLYSAQDWSSDGQSVLAIVEDALPKIRSLHLAWVATSSGAVQVLASASKGARLGSAFLAPDGAWIVSRIMDDDAGVSIMAAGGGSRRILIGFTPSDSLVGWSADGTHVLFISRDRGSDDLMAMRVANGQGVGQPFLIRTLQGFSSLGVSHTGALLYRSVRESASNVYRAGFDAATGQVGPSSRVDVSTGHSSGSVSWSPDGRRLAYVSWANGQQSRTLSIWSAETAQTRSFSLPFKAGRWGWRATTWSDDGRWVYVTGQDEAGLQGLFRINIESGAADAVMPPTSGVFPMDDISRNPYTALAGWSPDARVIYKNVTSFLENGKLSQGAVVEHRLADHAERELFKSAATGSKVSGFGVSPDGRQVAFILVDYPARTIALMVVPAAGGPAKTLLTFPTTAEAVVRWTPDSRAVVFTSRSDTQPERLLCDVATGTVTKLTLAAEQVTEIVVSPGGKEIAYIGGPAEKDEGVWLLEHFLPSAKK